MDINKNNLRLDLKTELYIPNPNLIPRFNIDFNIFDMISGIMATFGKQFNSSKLEEIFGSTNVFFTTSGRCAIYIILKSLNLPPKSKIGVPLYSCTSIFDAIIQAGHIPTFIDIDLDNFTMDPADLNLKINNLNAIIVIHTFGRPADMDKIKFIAKDIPIIEDCAHSLLSEYKGKLTGTIGDVSFSSFRSRKYISAGEGGMILMNNLSYLNDLKREMGFLKSYSKCNEIKHFVSTYITSFLYHQPWYGLFAFPMGSFLKNTSIRKIRNNIQINNIRRSDYTIFLKKFGLLKRNMGIQRRNSNFFFERLKETGLFLPFEKENTLCNYYLFPILFENKVDRDIAYAYLHNNGIDSAKLWSLTPATARQYYGYEGDCPKSEEFADRILTIPNYYVLYDKQLNYIIHILTKVVEELT